MYDAAILLQNVLAGAKCDAVGFEDANRTLESLRRELDRKWSYAPALLESALWSCNLLNERGEFYHPDGKSFADFLKDVLPGEQFDLTYNVIELGTK